MSEGIVTRVRNTRELHMPLPSGSYLVITITDPDEKDWKFIEELCSDAFAKMAKQGIRRSAQLGDSNGK